METVSPLLDASLVSASLVNGATTVYTFSITASTDLIDGDQILVVSPSSVTPPVNPICAGVQNLASTLDCVMTLNKQTYVTLEFPDSGLSAGEELIFTIEGFTNPTSTRPSDSFSISALDFSSSLVNNLLGDVILTTTTAAEIGSISISNENQDAGSLTSVTLEFVNNY